MAFRVRAGEHKAANMCYLSRGNELTRHAEFVRGSTRPHICVVTGLSWGNDLACHTDEARQKSSTEENKYYETRLSIKRGKPW